MKRYIVELDAYIYANNDKEARVKAQYLAGLLAAGQDNDARVTSLHESEHGSLTTRTVETEL